MAKEFEISMDNYKIEISKLSEEDGGGFLATVPALPGCMSDGETQEEALVNVKDAIKCWIETANELGREVPLEDYYVSENDYSGKLSLRIPKSLHKQVSEQADKEGCSINQLLMMYIAMGIGNEYGKQQLNIRYYSNNNEIPIIDRIQTETWKSFRNDIVLDDKPLFQLNLN